ncbi:Target of rapamycin complex 2 subunit MAPKAP1 [Orchesella cincta]|uniref:Target of rapamycin complex 2 subunit MAPKAP1 n=1 Tax=Orchesella cincta TaxID=48709 RepID=A0A1D2N420_ORCCI|nr:Target of rapamycin complex 2 subunit MAPKAP1 [Orchesella cincta]
MVLYDDKKWLCRLIRTAFTIEDDTGVCEKVLKTKAALPPVGYHHDGDSSSASSDDSFDIRGKGADLGHRRRSNTAIRLEKLEKQKKAQNLTQVVRVNNIMEAPKNQITFTKTDDYRSKGSSTCKNAVRVDKLLEAVPNPEAIPFASYAKFEASGHPGTSYKRMAIFLPFLPPEHRCYPIRVAVVATAKVIELIGLTLWLGSQAHPVIAKDLRPISYYCLQIADEDGEWDADFPPLDPGEPASKFSFSHLALVKCENDHAIQTTSQLKTNLSFLLPNGTAFRIQVDVSSNSITLAEALNLLLKQSGWGKGFTCTDPKEVYHFEKLGDPSVQFLDLSVSVHDSKCKEFCLVRNGAKSIQSATVKSDTMMGNILMGAELMEYMLHFRYGGSPSEIPGARSSLYPVVVSTGRFNRVRNALCVIWSGDRLDLEFQHKTKSYPLSSFSGVKYDAMKNRVVVSINQYSQSTPIGTHYLTGTGHLTLTTLERQVATELYHHLISVIASK